MRFEATRSAKAIGFEGRGFEAFVLAGLTARQSSPPTLSDAPGDKQPGGLVENLALWQCLLDFLNN